MARLAARQDWCRASGRGMDNPGNTSEDISFRREGRLIIDEMPAMEVEVTTSLPPPGKSPRGSSKHRGRASGSEMSSVEMSSASSSPKAQEPRNGRALPHLAARRAREGGGGGGGGGRKHSSSSSSSKKRPSSSSKAASSKCERKGGKVDRSPHRSPAHSSSGSASLMIQPSLPGQASMSDRDIPPPGLSSTEWEAIQRLRVGDREERLSLPSGL